MSQEQKIIGAVKHIPAEQIAELDYFKNRGSRFIERALINDKQGERERLFSDVIKSFHEGMGSNMINIVDDSSGKLEAAFTTFQWLTTNVGSAVLEEALNAVGKKVVPIDDKS